MAIDSYEAVLFLFIVVGYTLVFWEAAVTTVVNVGFFALNLTIITCFIVLL